MKIEVGKIYRTRDGEKVRISLDSYSCHYPFRGSNGYTYTNDGKEYMWTNSNFDIISEWTDTPEVSASSANQGPVREVTRKEIVPGVYGKVRVHPCGDYTIDQCTADELTDAIQTLTQVRDALEETK